MDIVFAVTTIICGVFGLVMEHKYFTERKRLENYRKEVEQERHDEELLMTARREAFKTAMLCHNCDDCRDE